MKFIMVKMMIMISIMNLILKTPFSMGSMLIIQTMIMITLMNKMMLTSWLTMITFLMMVGGLLILFMYMSSISSNEKFKFKMSPLIITIMMMLIQEEMMSENQVDELQIIQESIKYEKLSMMKMYNKSMMLMVIIIYLLMTMIIINKIIKHHMGPMRKKN